MKTRVANPTLADALDQHTVLGAPELTRLEGDRRRVPLWIRTVHGFGLGFCGIEERLGCGNPEFRKRTFWLV